ncbi:MAG: site-2 protease family protein [Methylotetracoccus sp.]|jgi:Zn-dependent protease|nr:site-2 protease family protein [Methylotetracoccus sp.]
MVEFTLAQKVAVWLLPVLFAVTLHEVAHGYVAKLLGDNTAESLGRLSLNPLRHIDLVGTVLVPALLMATGGFIFGWAKPVPVDFNRLRHPKRDMALVAFAGPGANLLMAVIWALIARLAQGLNFEFVTVPLTYMGLAGIGINVVLALLNLLPIPPLDGGRIAVGLLPDNLAFQIARIEPYGFLILLVLISTGMLNNVLGLPVTIVQRALMHVAGVG